MATVRDQVPIRRSAAWFGVALGIVGITVLRLDVEALREAFDTVGFRDVGLVFGLAGGVILGRAIALRRVLELVDQPVSISTALVLQFAATFSNNITPSGQAGGVPLAGLFVARGADCHYETGCAAILIVNVCNSLVQLVLGLLGAAIVIATLPIDRTLRLAILSTVLLLGVLLLAIMGIWFARDAVERATQVALMTLAAVIGRVPGLPRLDAARIEDRVSNFRSDLGLVTDASGQSVAIVLTGVTVAHLAGVAALWGAFDAVGIAVSPALLLAIVPLAYATATAPLPGGLGGVEAALIALVVAAAPGIESATIGAAVLFYRSGTYWGMTLLGSIAAIGIAMIGKEMTTNG